MRMTIRRVAEHRARHLLCWLALFWALACPMSPGLAQSIITTYAGGKIPIEGAPAITQNLAAPRAVVSDGAGGFYFTSGSKVYRVAASGTLTVVAGNGTAGFSGDGGSAVSAQLRNPYGLAVDSEGNLFILDVEDYRIRKVTPTGVISTVAGNGVSGFGGDNGPAISAQIRANGIAVDSSGNLFIADSGNLRVRKVTAAGVISTVAGNGTYGFSGDGGPAVSAQFRNCSYVAVDKDGNLFIADSFDYRIRKVTTDGIISTVAGNGTKGFGGDAGAATLAQLQYLTGIAVDKDGSLFIADYNYRIRKVTPDGIINTVAGNGIGGFSGDGGPATSAKLWYPHGVAVDKDGNLFIADSYNNRIRKVTPTGIISTVAGNGEGRAAGDGGSAALSALDYPTSVAVDAAGNLFIADFHNNRIRKITPAGIISTFAGNGEYGFNGDGIPATSATVGEPSSVAVSSAGDVFFTDTNNNRVRKVNLSGTITSIGASHFWYFFDYDGLAPIGEVCVAGVAADAEGNLYVAVPINQSIWKITPAGAIGLVAGKGDGSYGFSGDGGPATSAKLSFPNGIAVDKNGNLFIADSYNNRIRKITPSGIITTVAGNGIAGFSGDGGPATSAKLWYPLGVAVDGSGNLFIADSHNNRIRMVTPAGIISTLAGKGTSGFSGDGGLATAAQLRYPSGVAVDALGNLFVADSGNDRIRKIQLVLEPPTLAGLSPALAAPGTTAEVTFTGTNFDTALTISTGTDIAVSNIRIFTSETAVATLTVLPDAALGPRPITVTTAFGTSNVATFTIVPPFPDLLVTIKSSKLAVGFNGSYTVDVRNIGAMAASGPITLKSVLPVGLTYVSGIGSGWSCSSADQNVTCENSGPLNAGASTSLSLTVAVGPAATSNVPRVVTVETAGDLVTSNNAATDTTLIAGTPSPRLIFANPSLTAGNQTSIALELPTTFPYDVTGTLTLAFVSEAVNPSDDPAIQFSTGGRQIAFVIPADTLAALFAGLDSAGRLGFQAGTVAGAFTFDGVLDTGTVQTTFSTTLKMPREAPSIQAVQTSTQDGFSVLISLLSTSREVTQLNLQFQTTPEVRLSCGTVSGCAVFGSSLSFNVKGLFDTWYATDKTFGSLSTLRLPFSIDGSVQGRVSVTLRNGQGLSSALWFALP
jgi:sugar lactone lactonase YvrE